MKGEINWAPKGSKPGSPSSGQPGYGFHWHDSDLTQPVNISPLRQLPPPDIPDSVSVISHDSNNANNNSSGSNDQIPSINLAALPPIEGGQLGRTDMDTLVEEEENERTPLRAGNNESPVLPYFEDGTCIDDAINSRLWSIPHPDQYLLPQVGSGGPTEGLTAINEEEDGCCTCPPPGNPTNPLPVPIPIPPGVMIPPTVDNSKPLAIRNRYSKKKTPPLMATSDDEASETSSLLSGGGAPHPILITGQPGSRSGSMRPNKTVTIQEGPTTPSPTASGSSGIGSGSGGTTSSSTGSLNKKRNVSKTTHVTQV